jgi:hypothetical protein
LFGFSFLDIINKYYCAETNQIHKKALLSRLKKSRKKKISIGLTLIDRIRFILKILYFPFKLSFGEYNYDENIFISDTIYNSERMAIRKYKINQLNGNGKNAQPIIRKNNFRIKNVQDLLIVKVWLFDLLLSFLSLIDTNSYKLHFFSSFIFGKNAVLLSKPEEIHIFRIDRAEQYLLSAWSCSGTRKYIHSPNGPLLSSKYGHYSNLTFVMSGHGQIEELESYVKSEDIILNNVKITINGNAYGLFIDRFDKTAKYEVGFYSEGYWMRDQYGYSIEDPIKLNKYLEQEDNKKARIEKELLLECIRIAKKYKYKIAIYLHPCEERMQKKGFISPHIGKIDNDLIFFGEKIKGFSNIFECKVGVVAMPGCSIILDRYNINKPTICSSYELLEAFNIKYNYDHGFYKSPGIIIKDIGELKTKIFKYLENC